MRLVVIESPFAAGRGFSVEENIAYARRCMADCLGRGEAPIASHLLYTQESVLDDSVPEERKLGIEAGLRWATKAEVSIFYIDHGWSVGMLAAFARADHEGRPVEIRGLA